MNMTGIILAILLGPPALYLLYTLFVVLRLRAHARRLEQQCIERDYKLESSFFVMFPSDLEDPLILNVTILRGQRRFSFTLFHSLLSDARFRRVRVEPIALSKRLGGRIAVEPKNDSLKLEQVYIPEDSIALHTFGNQSLDAHYHLREDTSKPVSPEGLALLCSALADPETKARLDAYGGSLAFEYGYMSVSPGRGGKPFLDGIEDVGQLADALDEAMKTTGPYR